jgi:hypothetical protein
MTISTEIEDVEQLGLKSFCRITLEIFKRRLPQAFVAPRTAALAAACSAFACASSCSCMSALRSNSARLSGVRRVCTET